MTRVKATQPESPESTTPTYSKQQFLGSKQYTTTQKDLLNALLEDGQEYTPEQVSKLLNEFLQKEVE